MQRNSKFIRKISPFHPMIPIHQRELIMPPCPDQPAHNVSGGRASFVSMKLCQIRNTFLPASTKWITLRLVVMVETTPAKLLSEPAYARLCSATSSSRPTHLKTLASYLHLWGLRTAPTAREQISAACRCPLHHLYTVADAWAVCDHPQAGPTHCTWRGHHHPPQSEEVPKTRPGP